MLLGYQDEQDLHSEGVLKVFKVFSERVPDRSQSLTVATPASKDMLARGKRGCPNWNIPRSVKLDKDILVVIENDLVEFGTDQDGNGFVLACRRRCTLQAGCELASLKVLNP
jgi:hypothetical protein